MLTQTAKDKAMPKEGVLHGYGAQDGADYLQLAYIIEPGNGQDIKRPSARVAVSDALQPAPAINGPTEVYALVTDRDWWLPLSFDLA